MSNVLYAFSPLSQLGIIEFSGRDAASFLQGQLSTDTQKLESGRWIRTAYCSRQGKILANGIIAKTGADDEEKFLFVAAADLIDETRLLLQKFILRAKVRAAVRADARVYGLWQDNDAADVPAAGGEARVIGGGIALCDNARQLILSLDAAQSEDALVGELEKAHGTLARQPQERWWRSEILRAVPWISNATRDQHIPQHINFELLGGVDFGKGCFIGQEVIARLHYLGDIKRRALIVRGRAATLPAAGDKLANADGKSTGQLLGCAADGDGGYIALAAKMLGDSQPPLLAGAESAQIEQPPYPFPVREKVKRSL